PPRSTLFPYTTLFRSVLDKASRNGLDFLSNQCRDAFQVVVRKGTCEPFSINRVAFLQDIKCCKAQAPVAINASTYKPQHIRNKEPTLYFGIVTSATVVSFSGGASERGGRVHAGKLQCLRHIHQY